MADLEQLSVVVPVRNAERLVDGCLESITASGPVELIVVDGMSTDTSVERARAYGARILSDEGRGLPAARMLGTAAARGRWVALVDADVVLPPGSLHGLLEEFVAGGYTALQAGLSSTGGPRYWGRALAHHHRSGRSRHWFGVVATVFEREALLALGFDERFVSGEDIELRWRLEQGGGRVGVSRRIVVTHRFAGDGFAFARDQFLADGSGLGRMVAKHRARALWLAALPAAAAARGVALSLAKGQPRWVPYYLGFAAYNYAGLIGALLRWR